MKPKAKQEHGRQDRLLAHEKNLKSPCTTEKPTDRSWSRSLEYAEKFNALGYDQSESFKSSSKVGLGMMSQQKLTTCMVQTSKTDHFFKLAPFWSPLTDLIDFGMAGKLLTSATRWCSPFVDSVPRIWIKPKKSLIGCWAPMATTFGQSAPSRVQLTASRNGHNRHFEQLSLISSVCRSFCTGKIELYVSWAAYFRGVLPWLQRTAVTPVGFACTGTISRVIVKVTSSSDLEKIRVRRRQQIYA